MKQGNGWKWETISSRPSGQSSSPSHHHLRGTHFPSPQLFSFPGEQVMGGQWAPSSDPSPQSISRSQYHLCWMHWPLAQVNWSSEQLASVTNQEQKKNPIKFINKPAIDRYPTPPLSEVDGSVQLGSIRWWHRISGIGIAEIASKCLPGQVSRYTSSHESMESVSQLNTSGIATASAVF